MPENVDQKHALPVEGNLLCVLSEQQRVEALWKRTIEVFKILLGLNQAHAARVSLVYNCQGKEE